MQNNTASGLITKAYREGDESYKKEHKEEYECSKKQLIEDNEGIVGIIARKYLGNGLTFQELVSAGNVGLCIAAKKWEPDKGEFTTRAGEYIKAEIIKEMRLFYRPARIPNNIHEINQKISRIKNRLREDTGSEPTRREIADAYNRFYNQNQKRIGVISVRGFEYLNNPVTRFNEGIYSNPPIKKSPVLEEITRREGLRKLEEFLNNGILTERQKQVTKLYILGDLTFEEVGEELGISGQGAGALFRRSIKILRTAMEHAGYSESDFF